MPTTRRMGWPYPAESQDPWYDALEAFFSASDAAAYASRETENMVLTGGGDVSLSGNTLEWTEDLEIFSPITGFNWVMPAQSVDLEDGRVLWFDAVRAPDDDTAVIPQTAARLPLTGSAVLLAIRRGSIVYWRNGAGLADGDTMNPLAGTGGGVDGLDGAPGSVLRNGTGAPLNGLGINGDYYLDDATGDVYWKSSGVYAIVANFLGPTGPAGPAGSPGAGSGSALVLDVGASPSGNVYNTLATVLAAANALDGIVQIEVRTSTSVASGTYDFSRTIITAGVTGTLTDGLTLTFSGTSSITGLPLELDHVQIINTKVAGVLHTLSASPPPLVLRKNAGLINNATSQHAIALNTHTLDVYAYDDAVLTGNSASAQLFNAAASGTVNLYTSGNSVRVTNAFVFGGAATVNVFYSGGQIFDHRSANPFSSLSGTLTVTNYGQKIPFIFTAPAIATSQNNYTPTGLPWVDKLRISSSANVSITGLGVSTWVTNFVARDLEVINAGSNLVTLPHGSGLSTYAFSFANSADLVLGPNSVVSLFFDPSSNVWRPRGPVVSYPHVVTLTDAATIAIDAGKGPNFEVTITANRTMGNPTNLVAGQKLAIVVKQDAVGGWTLAFGSDWVPVDASVIVDPTALSFTAVHAEARAFGGAVKLYYWMVSGFEGTSSGEVNDGLNVGAGSQVFKDKVGLDLRFRTLVAGSNVSLTQNANDVTIAATGEANDAVNLGFGTGLYTSKSGVNIQLRSLFAGYNQTLTTTSTDITIAEKTTVTTLTDAATIAVNADSGPHMQVTLGGNRTLGNPTNSAAGKKLRIAIRQDAVGGWTLAFGVSWVAVDGTTAVDTAPLAVSMLTAEARDFGGGVLWYYVVTSQTETGGAGEANTASNLGAGTGLFASKVSLDLRFKSLVAGYNQALTSDSTTVTISDKTTAVTLTDAATIAIDAALGPRYEVTLTATRILGNPTNSLAGQFISIAIRQNGAGGHGLTFGSDWIAVDPNIDLDPAPSGVSLLWAEARAFGGAVKWYFSITTGVDPGAVGEANTASNLGAGSQIFVGKTGVDLEFRSIVAGTGVTVTQNANDITIASPGEANTGANLGSGSGVYASKSGVALQFKSIGAGYGTTVSATGTDITVARKTTVVTLTDAATIAIDASTGPNYQVTLAGNRTLGNPSSALVGQKITILIAQDAVGGRTLAFGTDWVAVDPSVIIDPDPNAVSLLDADARNLGGGVKWYFSISGLNEAGNFGEVNTGLNLGAGNGIYTSNSGVALQFKSLVAGSNVSITPTGTELTIAATSAGETNTASNLGTGAEVFANKTGVDLRFRSLTAGANVTVTQNANDITIAAAAAGEANTASNLGAGTGLYASKSGVDLRFKSLVAGYNQALSATGTEVTLSDNLTTVALVDGATVNIDAAVGPHYKLTIAGNRTIANPTNSVEGQTIVLSITQDGVGGRTLSFDTDWIATGSTALNAGAGDSSFVLAYARDFGAGVKWLYTVEGNESGGGTVLAGYGIGISGSTVSQKTAVTTLAASGSIAIDAAVGPQYQTTLTGNGTLSNPTNAVVGQTLVIAVKQDGVGSRTLAFDTDFEDAGQQAAIAVSPDAVTVIIAQARNFGTLKWYYQIHHTEGGGPGGGGGEVHLAGTSKSTELLATEVLVGGFYLDPSAYTTPIITLRFVARYSSTDAASSAELRLYDMGPGNAAFTPVRRATTSIAYAMVDQGALSDQVLTVDAVPGTNANKILGTGRVYEVRAYLDSSLAGTLTTYWAGVVVTS